MKTSTHRRIGWVGLLVGAFALNSYHALSASDRGPEGPRIVMIIRHAEKPTENNGEVDPNLSERGYERAAALAKVFPQRFPKPDFLIATKKTKDSNRPVETITPLANVLHEKIESTFKDDAFEQLAHFVLTNPKYAGKVVLIAWHHGKIPDLARALGVKDAPDKWKSQVFDRVWQITYDHGVATWKNLPEDALPGDSKQ